MALGLAMVGVTVWGEVLTPEEALARAMKKMPTGKALSVGMRPRLVKTLNSDNNPTVYVYATGGTGYMVLSADDACEALLGYGSGSDFDVNNMPASMKYWLESYSDQVAWARAEGRQSVLESRKVPTRVAIAPMTKTRWNQDAPYNDYCPEVDGQHCVTGCVATALAQVMKYHQWPVTGIGTASYTWNNETLSMDYGNTTFDWANMLDSYGSDATADQKSAVARLMYANGVGVEMSYTLQESGAASLKVPALLVNHYGYDKGVHYMSRDYYGLEAWEDSVYYQLANYGPVQYSGQSNDGGHSFVFDGYDAGGYFHVNWGWGGMSDGYFLLTALNPESQGIGGSTSGYNFNQDIIAGVRRPVEGSREVENILWEGSFVPTQSTVDLGQPVTFYGPVYNMGIGKVSGTFGLKLVAEDGTVSYIEGPGFTDMEPLSGLMYVQVTLPSTLAEGVYIATPVVRTSGSWRDIPIKQSGSQAVQITVSGAQATIASQVNPSITVTDMTLVSKLYIGSKYEITATLSNNGAREYSGPIRAVLIDNEGQLVAYGDQYPVDLVPGQTTGMTYLSTWYPNGNTTLTAGNYKLSFLSVNTNALLVEPVDVTLNAEATPTLKVSSLTVVGNSTKVDKKDINFMATVDCTAGYYGGVLTVVIFPDSEGQVTSVAAFTSDPVFIGSGESRNVTFKGSMPQGVDGNRYFAMVYQGHNQLSEPSYFTLDNPSGVNNIADDNHVVVVEVYTLSGTRVDDQNLAKGYYITRTIYSDGSVTVSKNLKQ